MAEKESQPKDQTPLEQPTNEDDKVRSMPGNITGGRKSSWPEVVGLSGEEAERKIKEDMAQAFIQIIPNGNFVTMDYRTDRVRIFIDDSGKVSVIPRIG